MYRMIQTIGILVVLPLLLSGQAASVTGSQAEPDFNRINNETYRLYLAGEWDSLLVVGKEALRMGIDYYYLRMRMGIAFYKQEDYRKATFHFRKALSWNNEDPTALEYLYYSLLFSGRGEQAGLVRKRFRGDLALRLPPEKGRFLEGISAEYLYAHRLDAGLLSDPETLFAGLPAGTQVVPVRYSNGSLSLVHDPGPGIALQHAYTFLYKSNHLYYNDGTNQLNLSGQTVYQHQYYISPQFTTFSGLTLKPALHILSVHYQAPVQIAPGYQGGSPSVDMAFFRYTDYLAGMGLVQSAGRWDLHLGLHYSSLNRAKQAQGRLGVTWYPLGNLDLYGGAFINGQTVLSGTDQGVRFIPEALLGFGIGRKLWIDLQASAGDIRNYHESNGYIVYNGYGETTERKAVLSVTIPLSEKGSMVYLGGRWVRGRSEYLPSDPLATTEINAIKYNIFSTYGGIIWKF